MAVSFQHKRGTRAQIASAAASNQLKVGEIYFMTDEARLAVATATNAYETFAKVSEAGGSAATAMTPVIATGTGASQNITLPEAGLTPKDVIVVVNGMVWHSSEYTISGTTLTITTNEAGDSIEVRRPAGATGPKGDPGLPDFPFFDGRWQGSHSASGTFTTVPMNTIATDTHGGWNAGNQTWTVPAGQGGIYQIYGKYRISDGGDANVSIGIGLDTTNADSPTFFWGVTNATRNGIMNQRFTALNAGDQVRLFSYIDGTPRNIEAAALSILRVK